MGFLKSINDYQVLHLDQKTVSKQGVYELGAFTYFTLLEINNCLLYINNNKEMCLLEGVFPDNIQLYCHDNTIYIQLMEDASITITGMGIIISGAQYNGSLNTFSILTFPSRTHAHIFTGSEAPSADLGFVGDIYIQIPNSASAGES